MKFLVACITGAPLPAVPPDWASQLQLAEYHRVTPLLARATRDYAKPPEIDAMLRASVRTNAQRNLLLFSHIARTTGVLRERGIEALSLKGPVLAHQLYGDISMRVCSDVDLMVRARDFRDAAHILADAGYVTDSPLDEAHLREHLRFKHDLAFAHADGTLVELHQDIAQPHYSYATDLNRWFDRASSVQVSAHQIETLCLEHALVLAIVHGTKHVWSRLDLLADVAALAREPLDWHEVGREVARSGAKRAASVSGFLLQDVLSLQSPLLSSDRAAERLARKARDRLIRQRDPGYWQARAFDFRVRERARDRFRYATKLYRKWLTS